MEDLLDVTVEDYIECGWSPIQAPTPHRTRSSVYGPVYEPVYGSVCDPYMTRTSPIQARTLHRKVHGTAPSRQEAPPDDEAGSAPEEQEKEKKSASQESPWMKIATGVTNRALLLLKLNSEARDFELGTSSTKD